MLSGVVLLLITVSTEAKSTLSRNKEARKGMLPLPSPDETFINDMAIPRILHRPVPFGHIFKEGFEDPNSRQKQPIDPLELETLYLRDSSIAREAVEKLKLTYQPIMSEDNIRQLEEMRLNQSDFRGDVLPERKPLNNQSNSLTYWNLARMQHKNLYEPPKHARRLNYQRDKLPISAVPEKPDKGKEEFFSKIGFYLDDSRNDKLFNFTSCDEFGRKALFHPNDIVDIDWVPFYIWTTENTGRLLTSKIHKFLIPTQNQVRNYSDEFKHHLNKTLDWEQPKLVMRQENMLEMLLIAADRKGLFDALPYTQLPEQYKSSPKIKLPLVPIRLKILNPYLAMMYCDDNYATIMAVAGSEPRTYRDKLAKAKVAKMVGPGFVVGRDELTEAMFINAQNRERLMMEQDKFISYADQRNAERSMNKPIII